MLIEKRSQLYVAIAPHLMTNHSWKQTTRIAFSSTVLETFQHGVEAIPTALVEHFLFYVLWQSKGPHHLVSGETNTKKSSLALCRFVTPRSVS